jgi:hypothetical protein
VFFVGLADNAIRPLAIGAKSNIPVPAIVLGAICGVFALGILGLILGPVVFAVLITVWQDVTGDEKLIEPEMDHTVLPFVAITLVFKISAPCFPQCTLSCPIPCACMFAVYNFSKPGFPDL